MKLLQSVKFSNRAFALLGSIMMRGLRSILAALAFCATTPLSATEQFFSIDVRPGPFFVYGEKGNAAQQKNPMCYAHVGWRDGSKFQLIHDLADGELYIFVQANIWNIQDPPGLYNLRINFQRSNGNVSGGDFRFRLVNKNTIVIPQIRRDFFLPLFTGNRQMTIIMPGSIQNISVDLTGSSKSVTELSRCVAIADFINAR